MHYQEVAVLAVKEAQLTDCPPSPTTTTNTCFHLPTSTAAAFISILKTHGVIFLRAVYLLSVFQSASRHRLRTAPALLWAGY